MRQQQARVAHKTDQEGGARAEENVSAAHRPARRGSIVALAVLEALVASAPHATAGTSE